MASNIKLYFSQLFLDFHQNKCIEKIPFIGIWKLIICKSITKIIKRKMLQKQQLVSMEKRNKSDQFHTQEA